MTADGILFDASGTLPCLGGGARRGTRSIEAAARAWVGAGLAWVVLAGAWRHTGLVCDTIGMQPASFWHPPHVNHFRIAFDSVTAQQDFFWFCVLLTWIAAAGMLFLHRANPGLAAIRLWLQAVCGCGALLATGELLLHSMPQKIYFVEAPEWDLLLSALQTIQTFAPILLLGHGARSHHRELLLAGAAALAWAARPYHYIGFDSILFLMGVGVAWATRKTPRWGPLAWWLAFAPLLATTGLVAELMGVSRRWVELSHFAIPASLWQLLAAASLIATLGKHFGWVPRAAGHAPMPGELKLFLKVTAGWLVLGLLLAGWTGRQAAAAFKTSLLSRVQVAALLVNPAFAEAMLGPEFVLDRPDFLDKPGGRKGRMFHVPSLVTTAHRMRLELTRLQQINPDIYWSMFLTLRDGYFIVAGWPQHLPGKKDEVISYGPATQADHTAWAQRNSFFEEPFITDYGEMVRARAPLVARDGRMLGWIAFELGAVHWAAAQAVARLQTFALLGLGVVLALFVMLQRLARQERERIELAAAHALEADRAKTAFLAKVSHELRTPVQSILGYGDLLAGQTLGPESRRWLGAVRSQGQLLTRLVNDLLDLSALQAGAFRLSPVASDLRELVRTATETLAPRAAAKGLHLRVEVANDVPACLMFDPVRVRQVLLNLVNNAVKFTDQGGVRVGLRPVGATAMDSVALELFVQDTGAGITADDQARLFRPFSRLHDHATTEGSGLGLALSAAICQSMGGSLGVESDGVQGSTFIVRLALPIVTSAAAPVSQAVAEDWGDPSGLAGLRVLVADDNPFVRELFTTSLRQSGAWVDTATDGLEAVELCARENYAVVVLDISMPWLDGMEAARRIHANATKPVKIVGVSAYVGEVERKRAAAVGMSLLLEKPVRVADLLLAVAGRDVSKRAMPSGGSPGDLALLRRLRSQFAGEIPRLLAELEQAVAAADRRWLRARAHYLKNGADVTGFPETSLLCAQLDQLARDPATDLTPVVAELVRSLRVIHTTLSPDMSSGIKSNP